MTSNTQNNGDDTEKPIIVKNTHSKHSLCLVFTSFSLLCIVVIFIVFI